MAESYTIESADDNVPINPRQLRELRDLLREDDDLELGLTLKDRPPAPGEQGAVPVALEILATAIPLGRSFADVLKHWIDKHNEVAIKVTRKGKGKGYSIELSGMNAKDAERLIAKLDRENAAGPDCGS